MWDNVAADNYTPLMGRSMGFMKEWSDSDLDSQANLGCDNSPASHVQETPEEVLTALLQSDELALLTTGSIAFSERHFFITLRIGSLLELCLPTFGSSEPTKLAHKVRRHL